METHFVVVYDHETKKFSIDWDSLASRFEQPHFDGENWTWKLTSQQTNDAHEAETALEISLDMIDLGENNDLPI
jgi:hypothetical protein